MALSTTTSESTFTSLPVVEETPGDVASYTLPRMYLYLFLHTPYSNTQVRNPFSTLSATLVIDAHL